MLQIFTCISNFGSLLIFALFTQFSSSRQHLACTLTCSDIGSSHNFCGRRLFCLYIQLVERNFDLCGPFQVSDLHIVFWGGNFAHLCLTLPITLFLVICKSVHPF
ncbi:hypothetical protein FGO68_gene14946 [Halteria grandinella]|uniref:Secreted protein n=1 Tax=Halteria grandinella TaxID=5974 RepID=A0A8J8T3Y4_HALGN|nr:hypothetical protein FGO68_gene14946 [Halteria grandinella]